MQQTPFSHLSILTEPHIAQAGLKHVTEDDLKLLVLLLLPPQCSDYRRELPCPVRVVHIRQALYQMMAVTEKMFGRI